MDDKKVGLTLGKFAPLHRGHQLMTEIAIAEMDEVIVIIYDSPEVTRIPLTVRSQCREYWEQLQIDHRLTAEQLVDIAVGHLQREEELLVQANEYLFVDTNAITTYMFALD